MVFPVKGGGHKTLKKEENRQKKKIEKKRETKPMNTKKVK